jgi:hypothetical protein
LLNSLLLKAPLVMLLPGSLLNSALQKTRVAVAAL